MLEIDHDPNDCCGDRECKLCEGLIWGRDDAGEAKLGDQVKVIFWDDEERWGSILATVEKVVEHDGARSIGARTWIGDEA